MTYLFAETQFLSRRAIAAAAIVMLHVLVAYLLLSALMPPGSTSVTPPTIVHFIDTPTPAAPPQMPPVAATGPVTVPLDPPPPDPLVIEYPTPAPDAIAAPVEAQAGTAPAPAALPVRLIGRHQLPNTEDYYPDDLRRLGVQGGTNVRVCVDEKGSRRGEPDIEQSSGNARLDMSAVNVARHGRYPRAVQGEVPVANCYHFRIVFQIRH